MVPKGGCSEQQPLNLKSSKSVALEPRKPPSKSYIEQRANGRNTTLTGSHAVRKVIHRACSFMLLPNIKMRLPFLLVTITIINRGFALCSPLGRLAVQELSEKFLLEKLPVTPCRLVPFLRAEPFHRNPRLQHLAYINAIVQTRGPGSALRSSAGPVPLNDVLSPCYLYRGPRSVRSMWRSIHGLYVLITCAFRYAVQFGTTPRSRKALKTF